MPPTTETDLRELKDLIAANHTAITQQIAALNQRLEVGFAQVDIKFAQVDTKLAQVDTKISDLRGEVNTQLAELKGELKIVRQPIDFWDFVKRSVAAGLTVTVVGGLLLAAWKLVIFGTV
jgi:ABC-type phosphate transport system auxiliary subunit